VEVFVAYALGYYVTKKKYVLDTEVRKRRLYNSYLSGHHPSSCFYLKHSAVYISKHNISETEFCLRLQVKPIKFYPIDRASPYLPNVIF
jgi:hypothetical protein